MVDPETGCVYVLLGRNRTAESYPGSNAWSDFGGTLAHGETPEACAAREVAEESLETLVKFHERAIMTQALTDGQYIFKICTEADTHWVVKFKWNPAAIFEFGSVHRILSSMSKLCKGYELTNSEKSTLKKYRWFCKDARLSSILQHPAIVHTKKNLDSASISKAQAAFASRIQASVQPQTHTEARVIRDIKPQWLEKDSLQLFSIPQICAMVCQGSVSCSKGICSQLDKRIIPSLTQCIRMLKFYCGKSICVWESAPSAEETEPWTETETEP
jgi:hypothetical protein